jgi:hypothetical protein
LCATLLAPDCDWLWVPADAGASVFDSDADDTPPVDASTDDDETEDAGTLDPC